MGTINIKNISKAKLLAALFNRSKQQGMGFMDVRGANQITEQQAEEILSQSKGMYFDYLYGRVMKIDLSKDEMSTFLYNRDNGPDAAEKVIQQLTSE